MRINTEATSEETKIFVHDFRPEIAIISERNDLIVLRHKNMLRDDTLSLNIFLDRTDLRDLYAQIGALLEPKSAEPEKEANYAQVD